MDSAASKHRSAAQARWYPICLPGIPHRSSLDLEPSFILACLHPTVLPSFMLYSTGVTYSQRLYLFVSYGAMTSICILRAIRA